MEAYQRLRQEAKKKISLADHMLFVTYPLVKDTKLLLAVLENIFLAMTHSVGYLLYYERALKRVPPFFDTFESKYRIYTEKCQDKYEFDPVYMEMFRSVKEIIIAHKRSPIEFAKKDQFVICSDDYELKILELPEIKEFVAKTKQFYAMVDLKIRELEDTDGIFESEVRS